jgi:lactate permease
LIAILMKTLGLVTLTGVTAGIGIIILMLLYLLVMRKPIFDTSALTENDKLAISSISL